MRSHRGGDDLLQPGQAAFGDDEAAGIVSERDDAEKSDHKSERSEADGECRAGYRGRRHARGEEKAATPAEWTELGSEPKPVAVVTDAHARDERKADADVIAVWDYDVIEVLELRPQSKKGWVERLHYRCIHGNRLRDSTMLISAQE